MTLFLSSYQSQHSLMECNLYLFHDCNYVTGNKGSHIILGNAADLKDSSSWAMKVI